MSFISLDRRFVDWGDRDRGDPDFMRYVGLLDHSIDWNHLKARHRVVVLAEAGSGKTSEFLEQEKQVANAGDYSFYVTVQNLGAKGLENALGQLQTARLNEWRASNRPAWFFLDSVDEAKTKDVPLVDALREIADGIHGAEARAHIIISGRHSEWEYRSDLESVNKLIPMPAPEVGTTKLNPNELLVNAVRQVKPAKTPETEKPLVVIMAPLDEDRVAKFARAKGVTDIDSFLRGLTKSNLWVFARRPLDLDWLVGYWRAKGKFGNLSEMLELSLKERLQETNDKRARNDQLTAEVAWDALERIGAALVLQRINTISIPDAEIDLGKVVAALDLSAILPDWSSANRTQLITRPVFDPANAGFVRIHNDNLGAVRSYLTARWLMRLRSENCPDHVIAALLFADGHGIRLVRPSMRETAAWLALWDPNVAREIVEREPWLFLDAGDPASLSLSIRESALRSVVDQISEDDTLTIPDRDALTRFSRPDLVPCIRELWEKHSGSTAVRELLLIMIELGELEDCADLAISASFGAFEDHVTQVFSGRALMKTAPAAERSRYADYVRENCVQLDPVTVWDAIEELLLTEMSIDTLLAILAALDHTNAAVGLGMDHYGPKLVAKMQSAAQVSRLLTEMLSKHKLPSNDDDEDGYTGNDPFLSTIEAAGRRLLELTSDQTPPQLAIDAALRVVEARDYYSQGHRSKEPTLAGMLRESPERRRATFWRAAELFSGSERIAKEPLNDIWQMQVLGFRPGLKIADLEWLIADALARDSENDRKLAVSAVIQIWVKADASVEISERIKEIASRDPAILAMLTSSMAATPRHEADSEVEGRLSRLQNERSQELVARDESWKELAESLRANPDQLKTIQAPNNEGVDYRLFHLWQLLNQLENRSRYAIADLNSLRPIFGDAVVDALRHAFVEYWRRWSPELRSARPVGERNTVKTLDVIGIVGVTLEAATDPGWAAKLTDDDAKKASIYGTLELNGLPNWFAPLCEVKPAPVLEVLNKYVDYDLHSAAHKDRRSAIETIAHADDQVVKLIANDIFAFIEATPNVPLELLGPALRILIRGFSDTTRLLAFLLERFGMLTDEAQRAAYIGASFSIDADRSTSALIDSLETLDVPAQASLVAVVLPFVFGSGWSRSDIHIRNLSIGNVERLVLLAYDMVRVEDDEDHTNGKPYSPGGRDHAEGARNAVIKLLVDTPGLAAFDAIQRLANTPGFPVSRRRMLELARIRAGVDAESGPWTSSDVREFETDFLTVPRTGADLQQVAVQRLANIQNELVNGDFNQGTVLARLPNEVDVQNWFANLLRERQKRSYSVEREPHVAEEKEPDIRLRTKASDASLPIEIKVTKPWTLKGLEDALQVQLMGRYLRNRNDRWGILLLVHQEARPRGWQNSEGEWLTFAQVVDHLRALARAIAGKDVAAPQMQVCVVDVSGVAR